MASQFIPKWDCVDKYLLRLAMQKYIYKILITLSHFRLKNVSFSFVSRPAKTTIGLFVHCILVIEWKNWAFILTQLKNK